MSKECNACKKKQQLANEQAQAHQQQAPVNSQQNNVAPPEKKINTVFVRNIKTDRR